MMFCILYPYALDLHNALNPHSIKDTLKPVSIGRDII
jgi:hypothetical protein